MEEIEDGAIASNMCLMGSISEHDSWCLVMTLSNICSLLQAKVRLLLELLHYLDLLCSFFCSLFSAQSLLPYPKSLQLVLSECVCTHFKGFCISLAMVPKMKRSSTPCDWALCQHNRWVWLLAAKKPYEISVSNG